MKKIRVLVVDDSVVIRKILTDILTQDDSIEVVGTAANGRIALSKLPQLNPDLVTLDVEMPELSGLETLPLLRQAYPRLPVIMFSTLTERGAAATLEALSLGASDYVAKPANVGSVQAGMNSVKEQLIPKIKALVPQATPSLPDRSVSSLTSPPKRTLPKERAFTPVEVLVIGSSTGGPQALATIFSSLPANFPVPILITQHMAPMFTKHLAARLTQVGSNRVIESQGDEILQPGMAYVAPGDFHLEIRRRGPNVVTRIHQGPRENSCRPAVDVLFRSAAETFGNSCLALVLTGMGQDGLVGARHVVDAGGTVLAQDEATSVVWGMPRAVTIAGLVSQNFPITEIADAVTRRVSVRRRVDLTV